MNKVRGKILYLLVEIFERTLNINKRPLKESIFLYNYGPGVRRTKTQRLVRSKYIALVLLSGLRWVGTKFLMSVSSLPGSIIDVMA